MWQLGGFARRSPTLDRHPDRSPGAAAQGPEMSPEMPVARLCALPEPRPPRASRSPERAEVRHADVGNAMPPIYCGPLDRGVSDRSAQRNIVLSALVDVTQVQETLQKNS